MTLKAKQFHLPFIILAVMVVVPIFIHLWIFFRAEDFSKNALLLLCETFGIVLVLGYSLGMYFKVLQSVELTDEGVWSLVWTRPTRARMLPRFERTLLKWEDMQKWAVTTHLIYLHGPRHKVVINVLFFKDRKEVVDYINRFTTCL